MLVNFANEVANLGYEISVFDQEDRLRLEHFRWLSLAEVRFTIVPLEKVLSASGDYVIVTGWLTSLLPKLRCRLWGRLFGGSKIAGHLRVWSHDELLRDRCGAARQFCRKYQVKIATAHPALMKYYNALGLRDVIPIENWIRADLYYSDDWVVARKVMGSIGHQPDIRTRTGKREGEVLELLKAHFGEDNVILCVGHENRDVAARMRSADFYVFYNRPKATIGMFRGEGFGLSLFEAMACGCVCIAGAHEGNKFLADTIPLAHDISEVVPVVKRLRDNPAEKEAIRARSQDLMERRFRFDRVRRHAVAEFLA